MLPKRRFDSIEQEAFLNLWRTYDRLREVEEEFFSRFDLNPQQYNALRILRSVGAAPLNTLALADRLVSRAPDVTRLLDRLESRGWVRRERPADDRRTVRVAITPEGLQLLDRIARPLADCHRRQLGHLTQRELRRLIRLLQKAREPHEPPTGAWSASVEPALAE
jgi:DNA-binding MarR family transcriptional regulator